MFHEVERSPWGSPHHTPTERHSSGAGYQDQQQQQQQRWYGNNNSDPSLGPHDPMMDPHSSYYDHPGSREMWGQETGYLYEEPSRMHNGGRSSHHPSMSMFNSDNMMQMGHDASNVWADEKMIYHPEQPPQQQQPQHPHAIHYHSHHQQHQQQQGGWKHSHESHDSVNMHYMPSSIPVSVNNNNSMRVMGIGTGHSTQEARERLNESRRKPQKQNSVGRWTAEEHQWFLKGLEMFQGPSWGEIARLIGTRTSTQVRTHAQKFFTKMARMNQTFPNFEIQIQKERQRLLAQGIIGPNGVGGSGTGSGGIGALVNASVTPTSASGNSMINNKLSPSKREAAPTLKRPREDSIGHLHDVSYNNNPSTAISGVDTAPFKLMSPPTRKARYPEETDENASSNGPSSSPMRRRRDFVGEPHEEPQPEEVSELDDESSANSWQEQKGDYGFDTPNSTGGPIGLSSSSTEWDQGQWNGDYSSRNWTSNDMNTPPTDLTDPDSLPSMNQMLYRGQ